MTCTDEPQINATVWLQSTGISDMKMNEHDCNRSRPHCDVDLSLIWVTNLCWKLLKHSFTMYIYLQNYYYAEFCKPKTMRSHAEILVINDRSKITDITRSQENTCTLAKSNTCINMAKVHRSYYTVLNEQELWITYLQGHTKKHTHTHTHTHTHIHVHTQKHRLAAVQLDTELKWRF